jgi:hypothetical protein
MCTYIFINVIFIRRHVYLYFINVISIIDRQLFLEALLEHDVNTNLSESTWFEPKCLMNYLEFALKLMKAMGTSLVLFIMFFNRITQVNVFIHLPSNTFKALQISFVPFTMFSNQNTKGTTFVHLPSNIMKALGKDFPFTSMSKVVDYIIFLTNLYDIIF